MLENTRTVVIWNPSAGSAEQADDVRRELEASPHVTICSPGGREAAIEETLRAAEDGAELIIAAGGDGSVNSVVEGLLQAKAETLLGILPVGSGNDLARTLKLPLAPLDALHAIDSGVATYMDVMTVSSSDGQRTCVNMVTGGNTGRYLQHMTDELKERWGPYCYLRGVIDVLRNLEPFRIDVICDDGPPEGFDVLNVFVANGQFSGGGMAISPEAQLDDGQVDLVIIRDGDAGEIASLATEYVVADYLQHELVAFRRARRIELTSEPAMPLTADGDEIGTPPLSISVRPRCLRVLVPVPADG
jgi:diacylglycerol kinase (ATP)